MNRNARTRASLLASWRNAQRVAGMNGAVMLNHASAAGMLLDQHSDVRVALEKCPTEPWWTTVSEYLAKVANEEIAPLAAGGQR